MHDLRIVHAGRQLQPVNIKKLSPVHTIFTNLILMMQSFFHYGRPDYTWQFMVQSAVMSLLTTLKLRIMTSSYATLEAYLNGIFSGNFSLLMATSKQSPKSMCIILPLSLSNMRLDGCLQNKGRKVMFINPAKFFLD